jgi:hypothetical protein
MDSYFKYWDIWYSLFKKYCINHGPIYFLSEEKEPSFVKEINHIKTGYGEWGERLIRGLSQIDSELIIYMQEDFWAVDTLVMTDEFLKLFKKHNMGKLQISEMLNLYSCNKIDDNLYKFKNNSDYTHNHQFSLWDKNYFISNIKPNENPWDNELLGTMRINKQQHDLFIFNKKWYTTVSRKGNLMDRGFKILEENNINNKIFL